MQYGFLAVWEQLQLLCFKIKVICKKIKYFRLRVLLF